MVGVYMVSMQEPRIQASECVIIKVPLSLKPWTLAESIEYVYTHIHTHIHIYPLYELITN